MQEQLRPDIKDLSLEELTAYFKTQGEKPFRATQIFDWLYKKRVTSFEAMKNVPAALQERLKNDFLLDRKTPAKEQGARDETQKFLFLLRDKQTIETVLIPAENRNTICVSSQAGCKFRCGFCASGIGGWSRNLNCSEIVDQVLFVKDKLPNHDLSNIVFMGVGEPLDNYENVIKAVKIINSSDGINFGARHITISTCGLIPQIKKLSREGLQIELAVSLHGSNNDMRNVLMPVNKKYPLKDLIETCKDYAEKTNRQVTFENILIKDLTCTLAAAEELGKLLKGMLCKMNLIPYNKVEEFPHEPPAKLEMLAFKKRLDDLGIHATIRMPRGRDVNAACGQLRHTTSNIMPKAYPS